MTYLDGVYWDLDGTIANTELEAHLPAFNNAFNDFGLNWNWTTPIYLDLLKINGGKNRIVYYSKIINSLIPHELVLKIHERKQFHYLKLINKSSVCLKEGVYRLIKELNNKKVRQFIVTSSSRSQVECLINNLFNEFNPFEFYVSSDDVEFHKPNPEPYLKAIKLSGIENCKSIAFEDSNQGLRSSLAANIPTILVNSNIPTTIDTEINLDCIIDNLGNEYHKANVIKGPKLENKYIDYFYLSNYLMMFSNAKN